MASLASWESSQVGATEGGYHKMSPEKLKDGGRWYFSRKEIEENSPSRLDGIDLKKETYLRKSYCTFLQDLGMRLKVPQVTIATAIIFCHRFYLRQSHAKNDRRTIATACMFLAGKVEETPRPLKDVILVSYEIIHKKDPAAVQKIKQKDVYEQQKELILVGERVVLATLGFDMNVQHPYKPLVEAIKKYKVAQNALAQVAWNFVNDGLRTSLCLQFESHQIAAGAIFLAAKFLKVKLPSDGEKVWWQEFEVTPRQLEEVSNQMLELYEQNRVPPNQVSEAEGSVAGSVTKAASRTSAEELVPNSNASQAGTAAKPGTMRPPTAHQLPDQSNKHVVIPRISERKSNEYGEPRASEPLAHKNNFVEGQNMRTGTEWNTSEDSKEKNKGTNRTRESGDVKDKYVSNTVEFKEAVPSQLPAGTSEKMDANKLKELREKRRKSRADVIRKKDSVDEYDSILKELEEGVELAAAENEKIKQGKKRSWSQPSSRSDLEYVEDGELSVLDDSNQEYKSFKSNDRKSKGDGPSDKTCEGKRWRDNLSVDSSEEENRMAPQVGYPDRDHKRHTQENHA